MNLLFVMGLLCAATAQVLAYLGGRRNRQRFVGMCFGITAILLILIVGEMAGARLRPFLSSTDTASGNGISEITDPSLVQQAIPIAPATAAMLMLRFANDASPGNLVTVEIYGASAHYVNNISGMGCSRWTLVDSDDVTGVGVAALYACNVVRPGTTVTISLPNTDLAGAAGQEFSGYQVTGYQFGHDSKPAATSMASNLPATKNADALIIIMTALSSNFTTRQISSPGAPWHVLNSVDGVSGLTFAQSYQFATSVGTYNGNWTWPTTSAVVVAGGAFPQLAAGPTETPEDALAPSETSD